jgi:alanine-glyoxylate transaminase/(R)-3-amino-2-methylpropionate-pyruvate transaminase
MAEPIQGFGGIHPMPENFIPKAVEHVRAAGGLYLSDEVQTGFGRLGSHYWGH